MGLAICQNLGRRSDWLPRDIDLAGARYVRHKFTPEIQRTGFIQLLVVSIKQGLHTP